MPEPKGIPIGPAKAEARPTPVPVKPGEREVPPITREDLKVVRGDGGGEMAAEPQGDDAYDPAKMERYYPEDLLNVLGAKIEAATGQKVNLKYQEFTLQEAGGKPGEAKAVRKNGEQYASELMQAMTKSDNKQLDDFYLSRFEPATDQALAAKQPLTEQQLAAAVVAEAARMVHDNPKIREAVLAAQFGFTSINEISKESLNKKINDLYDAERAKAGAMTPEVAAKLQSFMDWQERLEGMLLDAHEKAEKLRGEAAELVEEIKLPELDIEPMAMPEIPKAELKAEDLEAITETPAEARGRIEQLRIALDAELGATRFEERGVWSRLKNIATELKGARAKQGKLRDQLKQLDRFSAEMNDNNYKEYMAKMDAMQSMMAEQFEIKTLPELRPIEAATEAPAAELPPEQQPATAEEEKERMMISAEIADIIGIDQPEQAAAEEEFFSTGARETKPAAETDMPIDAKAVANLQQLEYGDLEMMLKQVEGQMGAEKGDALKALQMRESAITEAMRTHPSNEGALKAEAAAEEDEDIPPTEQALDLGQQPVERVPMTKLKAEYKEFDTNDVTIEEQKILQEFDLDTQFLTEKSMDDPERTTKMLVAMKTRINEKAAEMKTELKASGVTDQKEIDEQVGAYTERLYEMYDRMYVLEQLPRPERMKDK
ncbi:MAG: hypothetical protein ABIG66_02480 [Candidatus Kerfeldbacteria bacterium]